MRLPTVFLHQIADPKLSSNDRALLRCQLARTLEHEGDYEAAREAMGELWPEIGARPVLEGLDEEIKAEVLLRVGALTGWIGSTRQIENSQEGAKDLLSESISLFQRLGEAQRAAAAQSDLAYCYWREGAFSEARVMLQAVLTQLGDLNNETKAVALLRSAIVEMSARRFYEALRIHEDGAPLFAEISNHLLKAKFHNGLANVLNFLSLNERREDYIDRALLEYTAASFHFEQANHKRYQGCVENNLGFLFSTIGKFVEAHDHLDKAQMLFTNLKDDVHLAQVDETRARVMLKEGRVVEAEKTIRKAVNTLERGDELSLLCEALITQGVTLARLNHQEKARAAFKLAADVAQRAGDIESAGVAALSHIEELGQDFSHDHDGTTIERAGELVETTQDFTTLRRIAKASLHTLKTLLGPPDWTSFSLQLSVLTYEAHWIRLALTETDGLVTRAAPLLGFKHHQSLISLINVWHPELLNSRSPIRPRRRHLITHPRSERKDSERAQELTSQFSILHIEDNDVIASVVREMLETEGWRVETCASGLQGMERLETAEHYDLLLLEYDLPDSNGLELLRHVRSLSGRRDLRIVVFSGAPVEKAVLSAGADAFLRKPKSVQSVAKTIARLLNSEKDEPGDSSST